MSEQHLHKVEAKKVIATPVPKEQYVTTTIADRTIRLLQQGAMS